MGIIRTIRKIMIGLNPKDNTVDNLGGTGEVHNLSDQDGSLDSVYFEEKYNHHCGCFALPGGRCCECGVISCIRCHCHCGGSDDQTYLGCGKPLCREHSHYMMLEGVNIPFCKHCHGKFTRKQQRARVTRCLLDPFIEEKAEND